MRPVWLFSLDTEQFSSVPMTTGRLKAYFHTYGRTPDRTQVDLVHFLQADEIEPWLRKSWDAQELGRAKAALAEGITPVAGFSIYTWNAEHFLAAIKHLRASCPELLIVVGGPHVQRAADFLFGDGIDVVVLGEG